MPKISAMILLAVFSLLPFVYGQSMRVPEGFQAAPGTQPEAFTNTGWAQAVVHRKTGIEMVFIPAGSFKMGSPASEAGRHRDETPVHTVHISNGFYLGKYQVTQEQWQKIMGNNPAKFKESGTRAPVENVDWDQCQAFCRLAGSGLRLPTEGEWEYACRAGTTTAFCYGDSLDSTMANFDGNYPYGNGSKGPYRKSTVPVGQFQPNAWGLYDMHGNVWEWCQDGYDENYYQNSPRKDPPGASGSEIISRVVRGGSWYGNAKSTRSANRNRLVPSPSHEGYDYSGDSRGLRVAAGLPAAP